MLESHTVLFVAPTGIGKTHLAMDLLEREYLKHFDFIVMHPAIQRDVPPRSLGLD